MKKLFLFLILQITLIHVQAQKLDWVKNIGGPMTDVIYKISVDTSGNILTGGTFHSIVDFDPGTGTVNLPNASANEGFVAKYDNNGNYLWAFGIYATFAQVNDLYCSKSGFIYITGEFSGTGDFDGGTGTAYLTSNGGRDYFLAKYDLAGNYIWAIHGGSTTNDDAFKISVDLNENIYMNGAFVDSIDADPGAGVVKLYDHGMKDYFISKFNSSGIHLWSINFGSNGSATTNQTLGVDSLGNLYAAGSINDTTDFDPSPFIFNLPSNTSGNFYLVKYDSLGNFKWVIQPQPSGGNNITCLQVNNKNSIITGGYFNSSIDIDPGAGNFPLNTTGATLAGFIAIYDSTGTLINGFAVGTGSGSQTDCAVADIKIDTIGNIYAAGYFSFDADFDPSGSNYILNSSGADDAFVAKYSLIGNVQWAVAYSFSPNSIYANKNGIVLGAGTFNTNNSDFNPGPGQTLVNTNGGFDAYFLKLCPSNLTGTVSYSGGTVNNGFAKMYYNRYGQKMELMDSVSINASGQFVFNNVGDDSITIYVRSNTPGTIGTYYGDTCAWIPGDSSIINCGNNNISILLNEVPAMTGSGTVSGQITQGLNFGKFNMLATPGSPIGGIDVGIRKKPTGNIVGMTQTDVSGNYSFTNIDPGNYSLYVDIPGLPMDSTYDFTISGNENIQGMNFIGDSTSIYINSGVGIKEQGNALNSVIVYPNPASQLIHVLNQEENPINIELYNCLGEKIMEVKNNSSKIKVLNLSEYQSGIYTLRILNKDKNYTTKIILSK